MKTKKLLFFMVLLAAAFSCNKKDNPKLSTQSPSVKTGNIRVNVITYDSLGNLENDKSGVDVSLYQTNNAAVTGSTGLVAFNNLQYGTYFPILQKSGYEGLPYSITLNSGELTLSLPCAKYSAYMLTDLTGKHINSGYIPVSFTLNKTVPTGMVCKIAVLFSKTPITAVNYDTADSVSVTSQNTSSLNIATLPNLNRALNLMDTGTVYYVNAVPVSGGIFQSNLSNKPVLLGDNLYMSTDLVLKKKQ